MIKITYVELTGEQHTVAVAEGTSLMQAAVSNGIRGIIGECGGQMACGTCLVYVDEPWRSVTGTPSEMEDAMLEIHADDPTPGKRLGCQIKARGELDGLVVRVPKKQY